MAKQSEGYLLVDKPAGWTSFDVVNKIRYKLAEGLGVKPKSLKVGHAGSLDPRATGLLIILVGSFTKKQTDFMKKDKTYQAQVSLGQISSTDDEEGEKKPISARKPSHDEVKEVLNSFIGDIEQVPPVFSAVKISGRAAYARARAGQQVELKPKKVTVYSIEDIKYKYPQINFTCRVSSGTYIRSLARDVGRKLKTGAYLSNLRRITIDSYKLDDAINIEQLDKESVQSLLARQS